MIKGGHREALNKLNLNKRSQMQREKRYPIIIVLQRNKKSRGVNTWNEWFSASVSKGRVGLADFNTVLFDASHSRKIRHNLVLGRGGGRGKGLCPE